MRKCYLIRHGQSEFNAGITTKFNSHLTIQGLDQAAKVAIYLDKTIEDKNNFVGYVSPYTRCLQTALVIHHRTGIKFKVTPFLGESPEEIHKNTSGYLWHRIMDFPEHDWSAFEVFTYDGDTPEKYNKRLDEMIAILKDYNKDVILVSHRKPTADLLRKICFGGQDEPLFIDNCSISLVEDGKPVYIGRVL